MPTHSLNRFAARASFAAAALLVAVGNAKAAPDKLEASLPQGGVQRLGLADAAAVNGRWESSDPTTVAVYHGGYAAGLKVGQAKVRTKKADGSVGECAVTVTKAVYPVTTADKLQQFEDSRRFMVDGRKCYGSELNGQRASNPADHKNLKSNRVINPNPIAAGNKMELLWEVEKGTEIVDGAGVSMGTVPAKFKAGNRTVPASKFNYGMSKVLHGKLYLYAFSVELAPTAALKKQAAVEDDEVGTSAWLPLDKVVDKANLLPRLGLGQPGLPRMPLEETTYRITGGDPAQYLVDGGELGIVKAVDGPVPSHYLKRPSGTINVLYSVPGFGLGGQSLDSLLVREGLTFRPAVGAKVFVQPTYYPKANPKIGQVAEKTMTFLYGAVEAKGMEPIFGWVAKEAMQPQ